MGVLVGGCKGDGYTVVRRATDTERGYICGDDMLDVNARRRRPLRDWPLSLSHLPDFPRTFAPQNPIERRDHPSRASRHALPRSVPPSQSARRSRPHRRPTDDHSIVNDALSPALRAGRATTRTSRILLRRHYTPTCRTQAGRTAGTKLPYNMVHKPSTATGWTFRSSV